MGREKEGEDRFGRSLFLFLLEPVEWAQAIEVELPEDDSTGSKFWLGRRNHETHLKKDKIRR